MKYIHILSNHHQIPVPETFHHARQKLCILNSPFPPPPAHGNPRSAFCFYSFVCSRYNI